MPAGKDGRARRSALNLDVIVVEANALAGQLVDARCGYRPAVHSEISPAYVVDQDEDDVWRHFSAPITKTSIDLPKVDSTIREPGATRQDEGRIEAAR